MNNIQFLVGDTLHKIIASVYFEKATNSFSLDDVVDICLVFENCSITFSTNNDGETIDIKPGNQLKEVDMDEYGFIDIQELSEILGLNNQESTVAEVRVLTNEHLIKFGFELFFKGKKLTIKNSGDQLFVKMELL